MAKINLEFKPVDKRLELIVMRLNQLHGGDNIYNIVGVYINYPDKQIQVQCINSAASLSAYMLDHYYTMV